MQQLRQNTEGNLEVRQFHLMSLPFLRLQKYTTFFPAWQSSASLIIQEKQTPLVSRKQHTTEKGVMETPKKLSRLHNVQQRGW